MTIGRLSTSTPILDYYDGRTVLVIGGSGFLGTAICWKLVTCTKVKQIYVLVRGGEERLWKQWTSYLHDSQITTLRDSNLIIPVDGDACNSKEIGITSADLLTTVRSTVSIIVNLAHNPRLLSTLSEIKATNIDPALYVASFALSFPHLSRFVYASSAYANSHLHLHHDGLVTNIHEVVYPTEPQEYSWAAQATPSTLTAEHLARTAEAEYAALFTTGTTPPYSAGVFFSASTYAKHLTERLLLSRYPPLGLPHLMIFRPSCIGPALREPYPTFEILGSTPVTTLISTSISAPTDALLLPTRSTTNPSDGPVGLHTLIDEIPVDLCANQLIAHIAHGTSGPVHAIASVGALGEPDPRLHLGEYWEEYANCVPYVQRPVGLEWLDIDAVLRNVPRSESELQLTPVMRMYAHLGSTFTFANGKTRKLWVEGMQEVEQDLFPFWTVGKDEALCALRLRRKRMRQAIATGFKELGMFVGLDGPNWVEKGLGSGDAVTEYRKSGVLLPIATSVPVGEGIVLPTLA
ncbi:male sterility protein-domain-containing protein [Terfezia claveryi]|nr:male sterility protein-domain-containing protein [Terfezia claveryi]